MFLPKFIEWIRLENEFCTDDKESYLKLSEKFNRIYITENKEYLHVHIGDAVLYYKAENSV